MLWRLFGTHTKLLIGHLLSGWRGLKDALIQVRSRMYLTRLSELGVLRTIKIFVLSFSFPFKIAILDED